MNKTDIVEIMSKKTTNLAMLSVVFVGAMMVFVIPGAIEEAEAVVHGKATAPPGTTFSDLVSSMNDGRFTSGPRIVEEGTQIIWSTAGSSFLGGNEKGWVTANVRQAGEVIDRVYFGFNNPISGQNTCTPIADPGPLKVTCQIPPRGNTVTATFEVSFRNQNDGNSYCDLLNTFGGEQTKAIREKLGC
jgi:hypothetical protein